MITLLYRRTYKINSPNLSKKVGIYQGPAGATCGKVLSDAGISNIIIEKRKHPRYKACGGLLSERSLGVVNKLFGEVPDYIKCKNSKVIINISKKGERFFSINNKIHLKTERSKLDEWLVKSSNSDIKENAFYLSYKNINKGIIEVEVINK